MHKLVNLKSHVWLMKTHRIQSCPLSFITSHSRANCQQLKQIPPIYTKNLNESRSKKINFEKIINYSFSWLFLFKKQIIVLSCCNFMVQEFTSIKTVFYLVTFSY